MVSQPLPEVSPGLVATLESDACCVPTNGLELVGNEGGEEERLADATLVAVVVVEIPESADVESEALSVETLSVLSVLCLFGRANCRCIRLIAGRWVRMLTGFQGPVSWLVFFSFRRANGKEPQKS